MSFIFTLAFRLCGAAGIATLTGLPAVVADSSGWGAVAWVAAGVGLFIGYVGLLMIDVTFSKRGKA